MFSYTHAALKIAGTARSIWVERQNGETGKGKEEKHSLFPPSIFPFIHFTISPS